MTATCALLFFCLFVFISLFTCLFVCFFILDSSPTDRVYPYPSVGDFFRHLYKNQQWRILGYWRNCKVKGLPVCDQKTGRLTCAALTCWSRHAILPLNEEYVTSTKYQGWATAEVHNPEVFIFSNGSCAIRFACRLFLEQASRKRLARKWRRRLLPRTSNQ